MTINVTIGSGTDSVRGKVPAGEGMTIERLFRIVKKMSGGGIISDSYNVQVCGKKVPGNQRDTRPVNSGDSVWFMPGKTPWNMAKLHEAFGAPKPTVPVPTLRTTASALMPDGAGDDEPPSRLDTGRRRGGWPKKKRVVAPNALAEEVFA